jgi:hypothetical protein
MSAVIPDVDVVVAERRRDVRIIVSVPGRYWVTNRAKGREEPPRMACRAINISPQAIAFAAPVQGSVGDWVKSEVEHFGRLEGPILRLLDGRRGFVMHISGSDSERRELARRIDWFELHKNYEVSDRRTEARFVPVSPHSRLAFADGTRVGCFILDLSVSGAAIAADTVPAVGTFLAVGKVIGLVVRHFVGGFAVKFIEPQNGETVEGLVSRKPSGGLAFK